MPPSRPPTPAWLLLLLLLLAVTGHALAAWDSGHRGVARPGGTILPGSPQRVPPGDDAAAACFRACQADSRCAAWSVRVGADGHCAAAWCRLTADVPRQQAVAAATSTCDGAYTASGVRAAASAGLLPLVYAPVRLGAVAPAGWLRAQLVVMANGLSGALDEFWGDVNNSVWIGGTGDHSGAGHERGPYWLNGMVPLVAHLNASGDLGTLDFDIGGQVSHWINYILDHQLPSGWLGPDDGFGGKGNTYWTGWNTAAALLQYADWQGAASAVGKRCNAAVLAYIVEVHRRMLAVPTATWSQVRWQDWAYIAHWLLDQAPQGHEQLLWDAAELAQQQGWDWGAYYDQVGVGRTGAMAGKTMPKFPEESVAQWTMYDHGVNNAMGTKSCATWYRQDGNATLAGHCNTQKLHMQDVYHGQPHGMFAADECFGGRNLNRGIELCAVVEQMYSLQHMFRVHGDARHLDRCETIAFNALPGTLTADMWQHQYLQQANGINARYDIKDHVWQTDGPDSTGFGVAPNFGCCTANMQQGWPKYASNVLLTTPTAVVVALLAPVQGTVTVGGQPVHVTVDTLYPFGDEVTVTVTSASATAVGVRIPSWADAATISVDGGPVGPAANGTVHTVACGGDGRGTTVQLSLNPAIRLATGWGNSGQKAMGRVSYSPTGAPVPTAAGDLILQAGASLLPSRTAGALDIRSGNPGQQSTVTSGYVLEGDGHALASFSMTYSYVAGYASSGAASNFSVVLVSTAATNEVVTTLYSSPALSNYSYDNFTGYSPPVQVHVAGLRIPNTQPLVLQLRFSNNGRNLQFRLDPHAGLNCSITWAPAGPDTAGEQRAAGGEAYLIAPTNAAAVFRGALLYALHVEETQTVVRTWAPLNNTDIDIDTTSPWNYALVASAEHPPVFYRLGSPGALPFGIRYPSVLTAAGRLVPGWAAAHSAPEEPPASPLDCGAAAGQCGPVVNLTLVPYGATNIRLSALPWTPA